MKLFMKAVMLPALIFAVSSCNFSDNAVNPDYQDGDVAFGTLLADLDLDGRLDLVFANGHIEPEIARYQGMQSYRQPLGVYRNEGEAGFVRVEAASGPLAEPWVGRGLAAADFDGDGDLDLVLTQNGGAAPR